MIKREKVKKSPKGGAVRAARRARPRNRAYRPSSRRRALTLVVTSAADDSAELLPPVTRLLHRAPLPLGAALVAPRRSGLGRDRRRLLGGEPFGADARALDTPVLPRHWRGRAEVTGPGHVEHAGRQLQ